MKETIFCLLAIIFTYVSGTLNPYPRYRKFTDGGDPGVPLYLTPLIEAGKIDEAQRAANVTGGQFNGIESYSGYLTVNKEYKSNLFFWYFPCETDPYAPIILWLQGGPGASSLFGLFYENGPFYLKKNKELNKRLYRWNQNHHLIYIDNPVGTGFSFTENDKGYSRNEKDVGANLLEAVSQIFQLFPKFQQLDFWITGESYAGKYIPALAYKIHLSKERAIRKSITPKVNINLKGIAMGNALSDPIHQLKYSDYLYQLGLLDLNGRNLFHEYEIEALKNIKSRNMSAAFEIFDMLLNMDTIKYPSVFKNLTGYDNYFNYLDPNGGINEKQMGDFLQSSDTRKAIHVGNKTFHDLKGENKVEQFLKNDIMDSVAPWIADLLKSIRVCLYNGQLDIIVAYPLTESYIQKLKFDGQAIYKSAPRKIWKINNEIAGYVKEAKNLIEIMVRKAGHMAPADQPQWIFDMITRLTHRKSF